MAKPMRSGNARAQFIYADDIRILGVGLTVLELAATAQKKVDNLLGWANKNAVTFNPLKSEEVQFHEGRREDTLDVKFSGNLIEPSDHIRWLGVHPDPRLSFKPHVATWCGKALKMAQHMRKSNSVKRGADQGPLIATVNACVVPVATFGAEVLWPGMSRPTVSGIITPQTAHLCSLTDKALLLALRAALPVWVLFGGIRLRLAAWLSTLDDRRPLRYRASVCPNISTQKYKMKARTRKKPETRMTRIQQAFRKLPPVEAEIPGPLPGPAYSPKLGTKTEGTDSHNH